MEELIKLTRQFSDKPSHGQ